MISSVSAVLRSRPRNAARVSASRSKHLAFGGKVSYAFKARSLERRAAIAFVFEDPLLRNLQLVVLRELDQRCRLARNRVFLALLIRGHSSVDHRQLHGRPPLHVRRRGAAAWAPKAHTPARASTHVGDQTYSRDELER